MRLIQESKCLVPKPTTNTGSDATTTNVRIGIGINIGISNVHLLNNIQLSPPLPLQRLVCCLRTQHDLRNDPTQHIHRDWHAFDHIAALELALPMFASLRVGSFTVQHLGCRLDDVGVRRSVLELTSRPEQSATFYEINAASMMPLVAGIAPDRYNKLGDASLEGRDCGTRTAWRDRQSSET